MASKLFISAKEVAKELVMENHPIVDWVLLTFKRQQEAC